MPQLEYQIKILCLTCGRTICEHTVATEHEAKELFAKCLTASELHDCKGTPK